MPNHVVVLVTAPSEEVGREIANALLEKKLAACVNIAAPISSLYMWEGRMADDEEVLLVIKTTGAVFESKLVPAIEAIHPYDVPEIIALPIVMGNRDYLAWIDEEVTG